MRSIIFNISEIDKVDFSEVTPAKNNLRYSLTSNLSQKQTFVSWTGETPAFVSTMTTAEGPYDQNQMNIILEGYEWLVIL